jgi:glycosyltransferase involved in cell wall biosynthesis
MRIIHVIPALTLGGAEQVVVDLANQGVLAGHDVTVAMATRAHDGIAERLDPSVRQWVIPGNAGTLRRYLALPATVARAWPWLRTQDVLHCHLTFAQAFGAMALLVRAVSGGSSKGPRIVETYHAVGAPMAAWRRTLTAIVAERLDGFALMADDPYWRAFCDRHPKLPIATIANGINVAADSAIGRGAHEDRQAFGLPANRRLIGTVGRMVMERRPIEMLQALAAAALQYDDVDVVMGGGGAALSAVRAEGDRLGLGERLHLPGAVREPRRLMAQMDLYLSLNIGAATGIAGMEAAASQVGVVALQGTPGRERIANDWIWSDTDPMRVAVEIVRLLDDDDARAAIAAGQRTYVQDRHSAAAMFRGYLDLYRRAGAVIA